MPIDSSQAPQREAEAFSLVGGGLLREMRRRMRLSGDVLDWTRWRVLVTVAFACRRSSAIGRPTEALRPTTTARRPSRSTP